MDFRKLGKKEPCSAVRHLTSVSGSQDGESLSERLEPGMSSGCPGHTPGRDPVMARLPSVDSASGGEGCPLRGPPLAPGPPCCTAFSQAHCRNPHSLHSLPLAAPPLHELCGFYLLHVPPFTAWPPLREASHCLQCHLKPSEFSSSVTQVTGAPCTPHPHPGPHHTGCSRLPPCARHR